MLVMVAVGVMRAEVGRCELVQAGHQYAVAPAELAGRRDAFAVHPVLRPEASAVRERRSACRGVGRQRAGPMPRSPPGP